MIILSETTDNLQVVLSNSATTNQLQCFTSWRDRTSTTFTAGRTVTNTNNITDVTIASAPSSSTQRIIDFISIFNQDTANATVTIKLDANGTEYNLFKSTIAPNERIEYQEGQGFKVFADSGAIKTSLNQGTLPVSSNLQSVVLSSDVTNNNAVANTIADVTGLSFSVGSGKTYYFKFFIWYTAAATTTGSRWAINGPTNSLIGYRTSAALISTANSTDAMSDTNSAAYDAPSTSNTTSAYGVASQANIAIIEGMVTTTAAGTITARFASEVSSSAIVAKAGSVVYYQQVL